MNNVANTVTSEQIDDHFKSSNYTTITCNKSDARKVIGHFITRGYWVMMKKNDDGSVSITMSSAVDLTELRRRLTIDFRLA